ncbi:MAG TPA: T9SS type A sorting domain-containing protein, partial [Flavisolibacter sp.]|nr:T9SS type A sorting domain-containing protein [Flavisolibacter sp.]
SVDNTQESSLSQVRVIRLGKEQEAIALTTYPNPAIDFVRVNLPNEWQNKLVSLELFTASGIKVQSQQIKSASQTEAMQLSKVSKGMYFVKASCEGQTAQQKILKN